MTTDLSFTLRFPKECTEGVNRGDQYEPCGRPAAAVRIDVEGGTYPVCAQHSRARMVPLTEVLAAIEAQVRAQIAAEIEAHRRDTVRASLIDARWQRGMTDAARIARGES